MTQKFRHIAWHTGKWSFHFLWFFALLIFCLVSAFVWRVHSAPFDIGFAKSYIQSALYDRETGNHARLNSVVLYWPDLSGALYLQIQDAQLLSKKDELLLSIDDAAMSFSRRGLLVGRILPKEIVLKKPTLRLVRDAQGRFDLGIGKKGKKAAEQEKLDITTRIFGYIARPGQESKNDSIISRLEAFRIEEARLSVDDQVMQKSWSFPDFDAGFYSTREGMKGYARATLPVESLVQPEMRIDLNYLWDQKNVEISADVNALNLKDLSGHLPDDNGVFTGLDALVNAHIETVLDEGFMPRDVDILVQSDAGRIALDNVFDAPIDYHALLLNATYAHESGELRLNDTSVTVQDIPIHASAEIKISEDNEFQGPVKVWIDEVRQDQIDPLWPKALRGDSSEEWVVQKLSNGVFKDIRAQMDLVVRKIADEQTEEARWDFDAQNVEAEFAAEDMNVDYRAPMAKASGVYGTGRFDLNTDELTINISRGKIGAMSVKDARLLFDKVAAVGEGGADLHIPIKAKVVDVLHYISGEPINLKDRIGMDLSKVKGDADVIVDLKFPTQEGVKLKDFKIGVSGKVHKIVLPDVIETLDLSGDTLDFSIEDGAVKMAGNARIENRPVEFSWETFLESEGKEFKEKIKAKLVADPNIRSQLGIDLSDFLEGSVGVDLVYTAYRDGSAKAGVKVDATSGVFFVEPFDFEKPSGERGSADFTAHFKNKSIQKITGLNAKGDDFSVKGAEIFFKKNATSGEVELSRGTFPAFTLGETKGVLKFVFEEDGTANIVMDNDFLDAQPFMDAEENPGEYDEPPMRISVSAKEMRTAPEETVSGAKMFFDVDAQGRFNQMEMDAKVGAGGVYVRYKPDEEGKRVFRMRSDDAGAFLKAFQVHNNIRGGELVIYGEPVSGVFDRNIQGKAEMTNFKVVKAPALTKILSILSLTGIGEALTSDGLAFEKLEADFSWLYRKGGALLVLKEGRTSGNSLGLLFDGTIDNAKRTVDVSGTVVPMSGLNKVIGSIPLVGDILTGGSGGVFAATYSIKGSSEKPEISVNPLSVLTPGIVRRILFE